MSLTIPVAVLLVYINPDSKSFKNSAAIVGFAALWFTFMWAAPRFSARRQFRGSPSAQSPITMEASDVGLALHSVHVDSRIAWSTFVTWAEDKSLFVILPQPKIFFAIPKRAFNDDQLAEFREVLRRNIAARKSH